MSPDYSCRWVGVGDLDHDEAATGRSLGEKFLPNPQDILLLLFYDSIKVPPIMNASPLIIKGIEEALEIVNCKTTFHFPE